MALCHGGTSISIHAGLSLLRPPDLSDGDKLLLRLADPIGGCDPARSSTGVVAGLGVLSNPSAPADLPLGSLREPPVWVIPPPPQGISGRVKNLAPSGVTRGTERDLGRRKGRAAQLLPPMQKVFDGFYNLEYTLLSRYDKNNSSKQYLILFINDSFVIHA
jgi:hypothetical protein